MKLRLYCSECKKEIGFLPEIAEGQISIEVLTHECKAAQYRAQSDETNRLRNLLWVSCLCGACGHSYKYNRADDPDGEKGHEEHLLDYPDCPSSRH